MATRSSPWLGGCRFQRMADIPPGVIPISTDEYDRLYPQYERERKPGQTFQQWLKAQRQ